MKYFIDNNLPPTLARALNILDKENDVVHLRDKFKPNITDIEWIEELKKNKDWIVITSDISIRKNCYERKAWQESQLMIFFLANTWNDLDYWIKIWKLIKIWPDIIRQRYTPNGYIISVNGKMKPI